MPTPPFTLDLHLGWHRQSDGRWYLGLSVENGRIEDRGDYRLKTDGRFTGHKATLTEEIRVETQRATH